MNTRHRDLSMVVGERVLSALGGCRSVELVDYPFHTNAGDSLMWLGTRECLDRLGVSVVSAWHRELEAKRPSLVGADAVETPLLIQGGGNFGDLWPEHHELRLSLLRQAPPERQIVQLPQSLNFSRKDFIEETREAIEARKNLVLMWRDEVSFGRARELFPRSKHVLCPDMAFALSAPTPVGGGAIEDRVVVGRTDHEGDALRSWPFANEVHDWRLRGLARVAWFAAYRTVGVGRIPIPSNRRLRLYDQIASTNVRSAEKLLAGGRVVVTDRLHCMLMCFFAGQPCIVLPDSFGKIRSLYDTWLSNERFCTWAESVDEALARSIELSRASAL